MGRLFILLFLVGLFLSCSEDSAVGPDNKYGNLIVDTLEIEVYRDETPGFLYPRMNHHVKFSGHLDTIGQFGGLSFENEYVSWGFFQDGHNIPNAKMSINSSKWDWELLELGSEVKSQFGVAAPGGPYSFESTVEVKLFTGGTRPEENCQQLTGIENMRTTNSKPIFSKDGQWIYYKSFVSDDSWSIYKVPVNGGVSEVIIESADDLGSFALVNGDSAIVYSIIDNPDVHSSLKVYNLFSGVERKFEFNGSIWRDLVPIQGTNIIISGFYMGYPNPPKLVQINIETGKVDTLISAERVEQYSYKPNSNEVSIVYNTTWPQARIVLLNLKTLEEITLLENRPIAELVWAPNGKDYLLSIREKSSVNDIYLYKNGLEKQLTTYPGHESDVSFSPDAQSIVFTGSRRGEAQIWKLDL